jgi:hypothetical protein
MGDHLLTLGHQIDDAQHQWDMAMAAMAASTAIGIGLTFVTFGISDAVAEGAAAAAVGTMEAVCAALDISLEAAVQVMIAAIRIGVQLAVKFTWQFGISVVIQETANVVQGQGLDHVNLLQAAEFAAAATLIPGVSGKVTIGGKHVLEGASGAVLSGAHRYRHPGDGGRHRGQAVQPRRGGRLRHAGHGWPCPRRGDGLSPGRERRGVKENVGKARGVPDRGLIADALVAKTEEGVIPRFLTGDKNVVNALARMAKIDVDGIGGSLRSWRRTERRASTW